MSDPVPRTRKFSVGVEITNLHYVTILAYTPDEAAEIAVREVEQLYPDSDVQWDMVEPEEV